MNDLSESNGHDNLGFDKDRNRDHVLIHACKVRKKKIKIKLIQLRYPVNTIFVIFDFPREK